MGNPEPSTAQESVTDLLNFLVGEAAILNAALDTYLEQTNKAHDRLRKLIRNLTFPLALKDPTDANLDQPTACERKRAESANP